MFNTQVTWPLRQRTYSAVAPYILLLCDLYSLSNIVSLHPCNNKRMILNSATLDNPLPSANSAHYLLNWRSVAGQISFVDKIRQSHYDRITSPASRPRKGSRSCNRAISRPSRRGSLLKPFPRYRAAIPFRATHNPLPEVPVNWGYQYQAEPGNRKS